jgi:DNA-binding MltR family transcriptional regulator
MSVFDDFDETQRKKAYAAMSIVREKMLLMADEVPAPLGAQLREVMEFRISLTSETDRGSALMAAAFLDDRLKKLLAARLVSDMKLTRRAFDFNGPLGTFSSRIDFSYLLGLLPRNAHRDLHLVRSIRNKFAHIAAPIGFDHPEIKPLCDSLVFHGVSKGTEPGAKYRRSVMALLTIVLTTANKSQHISALPDSEVPDRSEAYEVVSEIWNEATGGLPYPVEHHHVNVPAAATSEQIQEKNPETIILQNKKKPK